MTTGRLAFGALYSFSYAGEAVQLGPPWFEPTTPAITYVSRLRSLDVTHMLYPVGERPVPDCVEPVARFDARYVVSRARGESRPLPLELGELRPNRAGCRG